MPPIADSQLLTALNWRYATKKFDPAKKIPAASWAALEQALVLAPSSFGLQPWQFVVVSDPAVRQKLVAVSWGQTQVADASHLVVFAFKKDLGAADVEKLIAHTVATRGGSPAALDGYKGMMLQSLAGAKAAGTLDAWQSRQVYIALGQFMAAAAVLGDDTCPLEGISPDKYDEILGLRGTGFETVVACVAGHRAADDAYAGAAKVRFPADELVRRA
jgi:nitroreductase